MPTTPPETTPEPATAAKRRRPPGKSPKSWRSPWIPLGPLVAGLALSLGFHVTFRLWDWTKTYEPLDISPPFAPEPLPGTSLDTLVRRYGNQLPPLLNPATQPDHPAPPPPPPVLTPDVAASREDQPVQDRTTPVAPRLPRPTLPTPGEPGPSERTVPLPPPPLEAP